MDALFGEPKSRLQLPANVSFLDSWTCRWPGTRVQPDPGAYGHMGTQGATPIHGPTGTTPIHGHTGRAHQKTNLWNGSNVRLPLQMRIFVFNSMGGSPSKLKTCDRIAIYCKFLVPNPESFPPKILIYLYPFISWTIDSYKFQKILQIQVNKIWKLLQALQKFHPQFSPATHYQQAYDISNVPHSDLISILPFDIRFLSLTDEVLKDLEEIRWYL